MVDNDLLQAAINAYLKIDRAGRVIDEAMAAAIEAYEAAKPSPWRPIEEAARNTDRAVIDWDGDGCGAMQVCWMERHIEARRWLNGYDSILEADFPKAMFRTIDPPTQDAVSSGMEGASDDESNKPFISVHDELSEPGDRRMDQETPRSKS